MKLALRGAIVVDGTGDPWTDADVLVTDGVITEVGDVAEGAADEDIDLTGLVLAPGFIDPHTHYDAQVLWDRDVSPSSWHGVTTVVMGNCGFGIAPASEAGRELVMRTLENVEGMPLSALRAGIPWTFESFPEYLDALDAEPTRCNLAALFGHTPLRFHVMGEAATERVATEDEVARMRALVDEGMAAGAIGFSTSRSESHRGAFGRPVPSRLAELSEIWSLAEGVGASGRGTIEATWGPDFHVEECARLAADIGRPVTWAAIMVVRDNAAMSADLERRVAAAGGGGTSVFPQVACRPIVAQVTLADPAPLANVPAFGEILSLERAARAALYGDPAWRERAYAGVREKWGNKLDEATVQETELHGELRDGPTLGELAAQRGGTALDVAVELALAEDLATRFRIVMINDDEEQVARLLQNRSMLLGLSDAGAHTSQLCDANFATYLLQRWVRELGVLTLEEAIWRLTGQPAQVYGLTGRGHIAPGAVADLVAFDPATVGTGPLERIVDLPGGADRLVAASIGIEHVWVGGQQTRAFGKDVPGARHGRVLRGGV
ncbi:MAG TPA: amidohydrolase family protein [Frankiaceae bacterium]|jgi:N-acyl-D-aspartate/D-glutamate deacylase|nr:amidohydrolase family protein [Frankiaceae bacterium]